MLSVTYIGKAKLVMIRSNHTSWYRWALLTLHTLNPMLVLLHSVSKLVLWHEGNYCISSYLFNTTLNIEKLKTICMRFSNICPRRFIQLRLFWKLYGFITFKVSSKQIYDWWKVNFMSDSWGIVGHWVAVFICCKWNIIISRVSMQTRNLVIGHRFGTCYHGISIHGICTCLRCVFVVIVIAVIIVVYKRSVVREAGIKGRDK